VTAIDLSSEDMRDVFFDRLYDMVSEDERIVILTIDHAAFSLEKLKKDFPKQYIDTSIAEQNTIGLAAGLALSGKIVFVYGIAPFVSLRVLEQITLDVAAMKLQVNIISVGAGFTYSTDGPSHQGVQDLQAVLTVPNISVFNSSDPLTTRAFAEIAAKVPGPKYIRIEKGKLNPLLNDMSHDYSYGTVRIRDGNELVIISSGSILHEAITASKFIEKKTGLKVGIVDLYRIKPLPDIHLIALLKDAEKIVTLEEGLLIGGIGQVVGNFLLENKIFLPFLRIGLEDSFCFEAGDRNWMKERYGLSALQIQKKISLWLSKNN